ncbi:MAG: hypothetical protein H6603_11095 [Flavobacteriales bacterium]|nr:hypothetical protein [Flavobacteriales bacterium]
MKHGLLLLISGIVLVNSGCVVNRPQATTVTQPDYNKRVSVSGAYYHRKVSAVGWTVMALSTAGGAVAGAMLPMVSYYDGGEKVNLAPVSGTIGGVAGFGTSYLITRAFGWGKLPMSKDAEKWVKKANPQYVIYDKRSETEFHIIHRSAETNYTVKNMQDVEDYRAAFPASTDADHVVRQCAKVLPRSDLPKVISLYPSGAAALEVKDKYVGTSSTVSELFSSYDKYFGGTGGLFGGLVNNGASEKSKLDIETIAVGLVRDCNDALLFHKRFPTSENLKAVVMNAVKDCRNQKLAEEVAMAYGSAFELSAEDMLDLGASGTQVKNYTNVLFHSKNYSNMEQAAQFYLNYPWLRYSSIKDDIMRNLWEVNLKVNGHKSTKQQNDALKQALNIISKGGKPKK